jgi:uncharacterized protein
MKLTRAVGVILVAWWLSGCLGSGFAIFLPTKTDHYNLPDNHIPTDHLQQLTVDTADGERLALVVAVHDETTPRPAVLFLHGQGGNIDDAWVKVMQLWDLGFDVAAGDYRGYGMSTGEPGERGLYTDAHALWGSVASDSRFDPARLIIWGHSLGTAVATELALDASANALVLEAPFTSMRAMVEQSSPYGIPSDWFTDAVFDTESRIGNVQIPVVVAHGTDDARIPFWMGERVYSLITAPKRFVRADGAMHDNVLERVGTVIAADLAELDATLAP